MIGQVVGGRYHIVGLIGEGGMGVVYKARDPVLDRVVAVKTINLTLPKDELSEYEARFYQEARAAGDVEWVERDGGRYVTYSDTIVSRCRDRVHVRTPLPAAVAPSSRRCSRTNGSQR